MSLIPAFFKKAFLFLSCFLLSFQIIKGSDVLVLQDETQEVPITRGKVQWFEDKSASLRIHDIMELGNSEGYFKKSSVKDLVNVHTQSAYWLKFTIVDSTRKNDQFIIEIFDFDIDEVGFYYQNGDEIIQEHKAGFKELFSLRDFDHKNLVFPLSLEKRVPRIFYMRFKSTKRNLLEPIVRSNERFIDYSLDEYILFGIFYGIMVLIIFYNILYYIILRKPFYLYYVVYALGMLLYLLGMNGTGFQYLWYKHYFLNNYVTTVGLCIGSIAMLKFFVDFFKLKSLYSRASVVFCIMVTMRVIYMIGQLYFQSKEYYAIIDILYFQLIFIIACKLYARGEKTAQWFIIAFSLLNSFCLISWLENLTLLPSSVLTVYGVYFGVIFQFIFISVGITESVREVYREKNKVQNKLIEQYKQNVALKEKVTRELEEKVKERTVELEKAKHELEKKANENFKMNIALDEANYKLNKYFTSFAKSVVMNTHVNFEEFKKAYPDELSCMRYLLELKEKNGFHCKMCRNTKSIKGKEKFDMRCSKCGYNESLTANTIFHKIKFPLQKAFYLLYLVSQTKSDVSATELAKILELQKTTCLNFKNKIKEKLEVHEKDNKTQKATPELIIIDKGIYS